MTTIKIFAIAFGLIVLMPGSSTAQQQTGQAIPPTRNPQTNSTELFNQQQGVQDTGSDQLLNRSQTIDIPNAQAAAAPEEEEATSRVPFILMLIGLSGFAVLLGVTLLYRQSPDVTMSEAFEPAVTAPEMDSIKPVKSPATKKSSAKKKRKQKRKRR